MTDLASPGSPDLNSSNRPVRTRMPGGVGGAAAIIAVPLSRFPGPPVLEQEAISQLIKTETAKTDSLIREANAVVSLLQERRTALISAAVTGKIDVRQAVAP